MIILFFLTSFVGCTHSNKENPTNSEKSDSVVKKANESESFESVNYLKISKITSGLQFKDKNSYSFFRIIEIQKEGGLTAFVEKIGVENDVNFLLLDRYSIEEIKLNLHDSYLWKLDSLTFIDTVNVSGYFNRTKLTIDLNSKSVRQ